MNTITTPNGLTAKKSVQFKKAIVLSALTIFALALHASDSVSDLSYYETRGNWTLADGYIEGSGVGSLLFLPQRARVSYDHKRDYLRKASRLTS